MTTSALEPSPHPLIALILTQEGMAGRLLQEHVDDGRGRCATCKVGGHHGGQAWPCSIRYYAAEATTGERTD